MTTPHAVSTLEYLESHLFTGLTSDARSKQIRNTPFSMIDGALGDAYTASCLHHVTEKPKWRELFETRIGQLAQVLRTHRFDQEGLLGGLSGMGYVLLASRRDDADFSNALASLTARIETLSERRLWQLSKRVSKRREDYDHALGLAGTAYFLFYRSGPALQIAESICQKFSELATRDMPESFWTCATDLDPAMIAHAPEASNGIRDLGFAHGIAGVVATLRRGYEVFGNQDYLDAAERLCQTLINDVAHHGGEGASYFQLPHVDADQEHPAVKARQAWCYGVPGIEIAVAGCRPLEHAVQQALRRGDDYFDPQLGAFDDGGLCHGIPGRRYLADRANLPSSPGWDRRINAQVEVFVNHPPTETDLSFWHGIGGTLSVWSAVQRDGEYAPALSVLGV